MLHVGGVYKQGSALSKSNTYLVKSSLNTIYM